MEKPRYSPPRYGWKEDFCILNPDEVDPDILSSQKTLSYLDTINRTCCRPSCRANGGSPIDDAPQGSGLDRLRQFLDSQVIGGVKPPTTSQRNRE